MKNFIMITTTALVLLSVAFRTPMKKEKNHFKIGENGVLTIATKVLITERGKEITIVLQKGGFGMQKSEIDIPEKYTSVI